MIKKLSAEIFTIVFGFVFIISSMAVVNAQESGDYEFTLDEITVTAQKREENQQKVPMAMEVITADDIKISGKNDLEEILSNIPGVVFNKEDDGLRIALRGMTDDTDSYHGQSASMPTVAINVDGVYSNRKDSNSGLFDLERVEVLYGPQSTLYASNSPGGIVNIVTANPKLAVYEGSGSLEYGNYNLLHTEGVMNAPVGNTLALRAAFSTSARDGYLSNGGDDEDSKSARLRALFQPNDRISFTVTGELTKSTGYFFCSVTKFIDQDSLDDPWDTDNDVGAPSSKLDRKVYGSLDMDLGIGTLSLVPSYSTGESEFKSSDAVMGDSVTNMSSKGKSAELRMSSSDAFPFTWIVGLNYYNSTDVMDSKTYEDDVPTGEVMYSKVGEESKAVFGNITYPVTDRFRATGGIRYSEDDIEVYRDEVRSMAGSLQQDLVDYANNYNAPDYKLGVEFDLSENSMIYADWTTSYRVQGFASSSESSFETPPPEKLNAFTVGSKNRFLDNKIQLNASGYYYDYRNYFVVEMKTGYYGMGLEESPTSDYAEHDPNYSTWGDGHMMGVDLQSTAIITPKDTLNLTVSYLKSEWTDMVIDYYYDYFTDTDIPMGNTEAIPIEIYTLDKVDYKGKSMNHSPQWTITASYKHIFSLWNGGSLETQIDATYKDGYRLTWMDSDYPYNWQEAYHKIDLSANYIHSDGKWTLSGYIRNLQNYADKRGYTGRGDTRVGTPRTYGAVLTIRY